MTELIHQTVRVDQVNNTYIDAERDQGQIFFQGLAVLLPREELRRLGRQIQKAFDDRPGRPVGAPGSLDCLVTEAAGETVCETTPRPVPEGY